MGELKKGDVVQLKSGGPIMTISSIGTITDKNDTAWCDWFVKDTLKNGSFPLTSLIEYKPQKRTAIKPLFM